MMRFANLHPCGAPVRTDRWEGGVRKGRGAGREGSARIRDVPEGSVVTGREGRGGHSVRICFKGGMSVKERREKLMDKSTGGEVSDADNETRKVGWAEMLPEALVEVIKRLPLKDRLQTVPLTCKAWRKASFDPPCWQSVDLKDWCIYHCTGETIDRMVKLVVERSRGSIQELQVTNLYSDASLQVLAQSGLSSMKTLCISSSEITESGLCELILTLPGLVHLDISQCSAIKSEALEVIGQSCKALTRLDKSMWDLINASSVSGDDSEALAIAQNMPKLKHLEMVSGLLSEAGLTAILDKCPDLEYLDVRDCWNLRTENPVTVSKCKKLLHFEISCPDSDYDVGDWDYKREFLGNDWDYNEGLFEENFECLDYLEDVLYVSS